MVRVSSSSKASKAAGQLAGQKKRAGNTILQKPGLFRCKDGVVRGDSDTSAMGMLERGGSDLCKEAFRISPAQELAGRDNSIRNIRDDMKRLGR